MSAPAIPAATDSTPIKTGNTPPPKPVSGKKFDLAQPFVYLVALVVVAVTIAPVLYVVLNGFRTTAQLNADPAGLPDPWVFSHYTGVFTSPMFWVQFGNSTMVALATTAGVVLMGVMAAFVIARYDFRGRSVLFSFFVAGMLFPATVAILPLFTMIREMGLYGNLLAVIIPQVAFQLPMTIIILVPFIRAIPAELEEAATLDGASRIGFFLRVILPLSGPGLVTVGVIAFVGSWNAYLLPLLLLGDPATATLPVGVQYYSTAYSQDTAGVLAFTSVAMLPAILFFTLAQRRIVSGLTGAVKG
ncbi:carbohydrate ABC transporter permease [Nesterenkonia alkaliphila]|uniref:ABC transporter permease subunit n=1 Tax=Nesterenkonia alkaliphila TaxID=1463631 RepID=A0A7K1UF46_9MICC|nr:carbohydrate ABC transporter permease [Nesterenkonia alkaliphila]MVT25014.1 ABC transporter permease subunit [Nesterenkonia alkaliphila]GFZ87215.1 sugar ABC transporter permease [Nesterenkonia alkaliphila]